MVRFTAKVYFGLIVARDQPALVVASQSGDLAALQYLDNLEQPSDMTPSANLSLLWANLPYIDRFDAAAAAGEHVRRNGV